MSPPPSKKLKFSPAESMPPPLSNNGNLQATVKVESSFVDTPNPHAFKHDPSSSKETPAAQNNASDTPKINTPSWLQGLVATTANIRILFPHLFPDSSATEERIAELERMRLILSVPPERAKRDEKKRKKAEKENKETKERKEVLKAHGIKVRDFAAGADNGDEVGEGA